MNTSEFQSIEKSIKVISIQNEMTINERTEKWSDRNSKFILEGGLNEYRNQLLSIMKDASFQMLINEPSSDMYGINAEKYLRSATELIFSYKYSSSLV